MTKMPRIAVVMLLLVNATLAQAADGTSPDRNVDNKQAIDARWIKTIDAFCDALHPITSDKKIRRLFGLSAASASDQGHWVNFKQESQLGVEVKAGRVFDIAQVWSRKDGATEILLSISSNSGDWAHHITYCFRTDGTLARVNSALNTFNVEAESSDIGSNGASRERVRYFDTEGKPLKVSRLVLDLKTRKPAPTLKIMDADEPIYATVAKLPFFELLKGPATRPGASATGKHRPR